MPPVLRSSDVLTLSQELQARVESVDTRHPRLVHLRFQGNLAEIFRVGSPVQYSYHRDPLTLWDAQTPLASLPWSVEAPSALFPLTMERLLELRRLCRVATLVHGAGLSSTGDPALDALLPLPEPYHVPPETLEAVAKAKQNGGRVLAWGTTVARALESGGTDGVANLQLGRGRAARVVDGLVTGFHEPGTSHYALEEAFVSKARLESAFRAGREAGLLGHEYGDLVLLWKETV
jgi:S-adenosylmethionine:tRNA ribosyltransferase-isomerase